MLDIIARSADVPFACQALATRVARLVPCDRVGIALLSEDGKEFQTYTARVHEEERRSRPRPEIVFKVEHTIIGQVVNSGEPLIIPNVKAASPDYLDANILRTSGFESALLVPLGRADDLQVRAEGGIIVARSREGIVVEAGARAAAASMSARVIRGRAL